MQTPDLRESLTKAIYGVVVVVVLWFLWYLAAKVPALSGPSGGRIPVVALVQLAIAVVVVLVLLGMLPAMHGVAAYYIGLALRLRKPPAAPQLKPRLVGAADNLIRLFYVAIAYGLSIPPLASIFSLGGPSTGWLLWLVRIAFLAVAVILVVRVWRDLQPVAESLSRTVADRAAALTEPVDYRECPSCRARNDSAARFCAACGKPVAQEEREEPSVPEPTTCPKCNAPVAAGARFCASCGRNLTAPAQQ